MHARELIARREFLALSIAAGAFAHRGSPAESQRTGHRIFSKGRIGELSVDNRLVRSATAENAWHESEMTEDSVCSASAANESSAPSPTCTRPGGCDARICAAIRTS